MPNFYGRRELRSPTDASGPCRVDRVACVQEAVAQRSSSAEWKKEFTMSSATDQHHSSAPSRLVRAVTLGGGVSFVALGVWALAAPRSFFDAVATFEPYNRHLLHDAGAFQAGLGAVLGLAGFPERIDGLAAALLGVGAGAGLHVVSHLLDRTLGGRPVTDIPILTILAVALLAAGLARQRRVTVFRSRGNR